MGRSRDRSAGVSRRRCHRAVLTPCSPRPLGRHGVLGLPPVNRRPGGTYLERPGSRGMIRAKSRGRWRLPLLARWSARSGTISRPDEDRPQRAQDEERSERDVRAATDPARREQDDDDDATEDEREDDAAERPTATGEQ